MVQAVAVEVEVMQAVEAERVGEQAEAAWWREALGGAQLRAGVRSVAAKVAAAGGAAGALLAGVVVVVVVAVVVVESSVVRTGGIWKLPRFARCGKLGRGV